MQEVYIHVGLHKTATTFLQREVFPKLKGVKYFDASKNENRHFILSLIDEAGKILISDEDLSGSPLSLEKNKRYTIAKALKILFPDAKIIVGVRGRKSWYESVKNHLMRIKPYLTSREIDSFFDHSYLDMDDYVTYLKSLFGEKNVCVYRYEDLKQNPALVVRKICTFMNVPFPYFENKKINFSFRSLSLSIIRFFSISIKKCYRMYLNKKSGVK